MAKPDDTGKPDKPPGKPEEPEAVPEAHAATGSIEGSAAKLAGTARKGPEPDFVTVPDFTADAAIAAMQTAFATDPKQAVAFPPGAYALGSRAGYSTVFDLSSYGDGLTFISQTKQ